MYHNKFIRQDGNIPSCMQHSPYMQSLMTSASAPSDISPVQQSMGQFPLGIPASQASTSPAQVAIPMQPNQQPISQQIIPPTTTGQVPQTVESTYFIPGFLRTQIGRRVRVEFLIGTNGTTDRTGILIGVGASYILLRDPNEDNIIMADLYSIKFVTILL